MIASLYSETAKWWLPAGGGEKEGEGEGQAPEGEGDWGKEGGSLVMLTTNTTVNGNPLFWVYYSGFYNKKKPNEWNTQ